MNIFNFNDYILKCDYLYKYQITSVHSFPKPVALSISFSSKQFKNFFTNYSVLHWSELAIETTLFFIFFILFSFKPIVNFNKLGGENFNLTINLKKRINFYLFHNLFFLYFSLSDTFFQNVQYFKKKKVYLNYFSKINFLNFSELKLYQKEFLNSPLSRDLCFNANIIFKLKNQ